MDNNETINDLHVLSDEENNFINHFDKFLYDENKHIMLIKGIKGTGKTFISTKIVDKLKKNNIPFIYLSPTGKSVISLAFHIFKNNIQPSTIHQLIYKYECNSETNPSVKIFLLKNEVFYDNAVFIINNAQLISDLESVDGMSFGSGKLLSDIIECFKIDCKCNRKIIFIGNDTLLSPINMNISPAVNKSYIEEKYKFKVDEVTLHKRYNNTNMAIHENSLEVSKAIQNKDCNNLMFKYDNTFFNVKDENELISKFIDLKNNYFYSNVILFHQIKKPKSIMIELEPNYTPILLNYMKMIN